MICHLYYLFRQERCVCLTSISYPVIDDFDGQINCLRLVSQRIQGFLKERFLLFSMSWHNVAVPCHEIIHYVFCWWTHVYREDVILGKIYVLYTALSAKVFSGTSMLLLFSYMWWASVWLSCSCNHTALVDCVGTFSGLIVPQARCMLWARLSCIVRLIWGSWCAHGLLPLVKLKVWRRYCGGRYTCNGWSGSRVLPVQLVISCGKTLRWFFPLWVLSCWCKGLRFGEFLLTKF